MFSPFPALCAVASIPSGAFQKKIDAAFALVSAAPAPTSVSISGALPDS